MPWCWLGGWKHPQVLNLEMDVSDFAGAGSDGFTHTRCGLAAASLNLQLLGACVPLLVWDFVGPMGTCQPQGLVTLTLLLAPGGCCPAHCFVPPCHHL